MLVYQSVLVVSVVQVVMCRADVSLWPRPSPSWTPVAGRVLREALTGPLSGHQVMLMVDDGVQRSLSLDLLLTGLTSPTVLLHTTTHNTDNHFTTQQLPTAQDVLLVVVGTGSPWLLWSPPGWLSPRVVLVLVAAQTCSARKHFQSPLLQNTPSVALLCLNHKPQTPEYSTYSVMTHLPLSANPEPVSLGTWHPNTFMTLEHIFPDQFQDFGGTALRATVSIFDKPAVFQRDDGEVDGFSTRILAAMAYWLNFTYTYNIPEVAVWGEYLENGTYTGIIGDVQRGESHLAINYFALTYQRSQDFDYSVSYFREGFGLILRDPPPLPHWQSILYPYTGVVWAAVCGVVILTTVAYYFVSFRGIRLSFIISFLIVFQSFLSQNVNQVPRVWVSRGLLGLWLLATWVLRVSYTSNLMAFLTVPTFQPPLTTLVQLADSEFRLCMVNYGEFVPEALATSSHPILARLGAKMDLVPSAEHLPFMGQEGCMELVIAGTHAHVDAYSFVLLQYSDYDADSQVYPLKEQLYVGSQVFFFTKRTPWKYKFDIGMRRLVEAGLVLYWYTEIMQEETHNPKVRESRLPVLSLSHLQGPFLLLAVGGGLATIALLAERLLHPNTTSP
ncbi:hypothetical protein Pcinc_019601 [Petrolisthes cinctipes]|uniref:Ionotropic glutamate receptor L-glutamate and glycine-binding domain-containing protein n=1 Tax=Petrolisthes cinctipes TaxID=88211 RepID=A0AAE1FLU8_PETCI|nr:hypothetical protein Pcinc_019601 [Petrolisthes cinctipes]